MINIIILLFETCVNCRGVYSCTTFDFFPPPGPLILFPPLLTPPLIFFPSRAILRIALFFYGYFTVFHCISLSFFLFDISLYLNEDGVGAQDGHIGV